MESIKFYIEQWFAGSSSSLRYSRMTYGRIDFSQTRLRSVVIGEVTVISKDLSEFNRSLGIT